MPTSTSLLPASYSVALEAATVKLFITILIPISLSA